MRLTALATLSLVALAPLAAAAQDSPEELAVEARRGFMVMLGSNFGTLAAMAKGDMAYDEPAAVRAATNIEALTKYDVGMHFIPGTAKGEVEGSEASPDIWLDTAKFGERFAALNQAAAGLPAAVTGGQEQVGAAVQKMGGTCKACHDDFREE